MGSPADHNQLILRVVGLSQSMKQHIKEHPQFAGLYSIDETNPRHSVKKKDLTTLIVGKILPFLLKSFDHYDDEDELLWEAGLFDQDRISSEVITEEEVREAKIRIQKVLRDLG